VNDSRVSVLDYEPTTSDLRKDVITGLAADPKTLPCKYFYDQRGCALFEQICELDEYYLTRTEIAIMERHGAEMAAGIGRECMLIEYGSGSSRKTRLLLKELHQIAAYVPVDIARDHLLESATALSSLYPDLEVLPVCADFTNSFEAPQASRPIRRSVVYFPGSTVGNFNEGEVQCLLSSIRELVGPSGGLLIGMDLQKDVAVLEAAYNDQQGVTSDFNLNLLARINRELKADFAIDQFEHRAQYNEPAGGIEIEIVSRVEQTVRIDDDVFEFAAGEAICTEHSHKYRLEDFGSLAQAAGLKEARRWTDSQEYFAVVLYEVTGG
jgi:dimethylhistidine N-methyltransferase